MNTWGEFADFSPELAAAGQRLFDLHQVAFLATIRRSGAPRIHPVVPIVSADRLYLFIPPDSPKCGDLRRDGRYALHAMLGENDEEFTVRGQAEEIDDHQCWVDVAAAASYTVQREHALFALSVGSCLWGVWERVGQPDTRSLRRRWPA